MATTTPVSSGSRSRKLRGWLWTVSCLLPATLAQAHLPAHYGVEFIRVHPRSVSVTAEDNSAGEPLTATEPDPLAAYRAQVLQRERDQGPYGAGLTDPLLSLAHYHLARAQPVRASEYFLRALQLTRVNEGPDSARQLPILLGLLKSYRASADLPALDTWQRYHFNLTQTLAEVPADIKQQALLDYLAWQREAVRARLPDSPARLLQAYMLNAWELQRVGETGLTQPRWRQQLALSQLANLYLLRSGEQVRGRELATPHSRELAASQLASESFLQTRLTGLQRKALDNGVQLLQTLLTQLHPTQTVERARLLLELGDWYQWNDRTRQAAAQYRQVALLLNQSGNQALLQTWLGGAVELPWDRAVWASGQTSRDVAGTVVTVSFDVSARGQASNIKLPAQAQTAAAVRLGRMLRDTHFRPRFSQGFAESESRLTRSYQLLDQG